MPPGSPTLTHSTVLGRAAASELLGEAFGCVNPQASLPSGCFLPTLSSASTGCLLCMQGTKPGGGGGGGGCKGRRARPAFLWEWSSLRGPENRALLGASPKGQSCCDSRRSSVTCRVKDWDPCRSAVAVAEFYPNRTTPPSCVAALHEAD